MLQFQCKWDGITETQREHSAQLEVIKYIIAYFVSVSRTARYETSFSKKLRTRSFFLRFYELQINQKIESSQIQDVFTIVKPMLIASL